MSIFRDLMSFLSAQSKRPAELLVLLGVALGIFAASLQNQTPGEGRSLVLLGVVIAMAGVTMIMLTYLQQTRKRAALEERISRAEFYRLRHEVGRLKSQTANVANFTPEEREKIVSEVKTNLSKSAANKLASIWAEEFQQVSAEQKHDSIFLETAEELVDRLEEEISALGRRANVNLTIGILISGLGLLVLTWFVVAATTDLAIGLNAENAALRFAVRLSLAVFIQVFAYFFLRLYRYSIFEIKYFQNEITVAQFKLLALVGAMQTKDNAVVGAICQDLAKTERNFVLKKGESTVALKRDEIERDYETRLFTLIEKLESSEKSRS